MNRPTFTKVNVFIAMLYLPNIIPLVICHHAMEKTDGNYQYLQRCDAYYKCEDGVASAVKCPNGTVFDAIKRSCENEGSCPSVP